MWSCSVYLPMGSCSRFWRGPPHRLGCCSLWRPHRRSASCPVPACSAAPCGPRKPSPSLRPACFLAFPPSSPILRRPWHCLASPSSTASLGFLRRCHSCCCRPSPWWPFLMGGLRSWLAFGFCLPLLAPWRYCFASAVGAGSIAPSAPFCPAASSAVAGPQRSRPGASCWWPTW